MADLRISNGDPFIITIPEAAVTAGDANQDGGVVSIDLGYFAASAVPPVLAGGFTVTGGTALFDVGSTTEFADGFTVSGGDVTLDTGNVVVTLGDVEIAAGMLTIGTVDVSDVGGTVTFTGPIDSASPMTIGAITLTDDTTVLTCSVGLQATGPIFATSSASVTYLVETIAAVTVTAAPYELAAGVRSVQLVSNGAGTGPYAITLGNNNGVNHCVTVVMTAFDTDTFTIACLQGTLTFASVGGVATFQHLGGGVWTMVGAQLNAILTP